jgi:hypothetical protein
MSDLIGVATVPSPPTSNSWIIRVILAAFLGEIRARLPRDGGGEGAAQTLLVLMVHERNGSETEWRGDDTQIDCVQGSY